MPALSQLAISNLALAKLPTNPIASIDENSLEARECRRFYPQVIADFLEGPHDWSFANKRQVLAEVTNSRPYEWGFAYALPADCGSPIRVVPDFSGLGLTIYEFGQHLKIFPHSYEIESGTLYTSVPDATLEYTVNDVSGVAVSQLAITAIAAELAARICYPIKQDTVREQKLQGDAEVALERAIADDRNRQPQIYADYTSESIIARHGGFDVPGLRVGQSTTTSTSTSTSSAPPPAPSLLAPANSSLPVITGTTTKGQTLTCSSGSWLNSPASFSFQWMRNGFAISSATLATYVLVDADVATTITCVVSATNASGTTPATATGVGPVIDLAPVNTLAPVASGTPTVGQTLSVTTGIWANSPVSYGYQWKRNGSAITAATASTYLLVTADNGATITCTVTATNSGGSASVASNGLGPVGSVAPIYDARFGTDTTTAAATGWFTFGLNSGNRRVWVDSSKADDTGDGLSAATAKKTLNAAWTVFTTGYTSGDQLMFAGTGGRTYADSTGNNALTGKGGVSNTYPTAYLSYDPADAANSGKYGKLVGPDMPIVMLPANGVGGGVNIFSMMNDDGTNYVAVQGLGIKNAGNEAGQAVFRNYRHDGMVFQNCRFNAVGLTYNNISATAALATNVSKCSFWGQWTSDGNCSGLLAEFQNGFYMQDCVFAHCGWKIGANRDDAATAGGTSSIGKGHGSYYHATNFNGRIDRIVYADSSADGFNCRGGANTSCIVSIDEAIAGQLGGFSSSYTEAPSGVLVTVDDWMVMGGADINASAPRGYGPASSNTVSGSYIRNIAMFDNPKKGSVNSFTFTPYSNADALQADQFLLVDKAHAYNYASSFESPSTTYPTKIHDTYTNSIFDVLTPTLNSPTMTNVTTYSGAPVGYKTRAQVYSAMGFTQSASVGKAELENAMVWRPDLPWAQALITIGLPTMGLTPTYPNVGPPSMTGITPAVIFTVTLGALALSATTFAHGSSTSGTISGATEGSSITASGLPTGLTINSAARTWAWDGTGTASTGTIVLTETLASSAVTNSGRTSSISYTISGGAWTPASLPGLAFWVEADPAKLYTDAGTTLVSADGQAVQQANDKSGNARNVSQSTLASRPLYRTGAGKPYLDFDGSNDVLSSALYASTDGTGQHYIAVSCYFNANATTQVAANFKGSGDTSWIRDNAGAASGTSWTTGGAATDDTNGTLTAATPVVLIFTITSAAIELFKDNVSDGATSVTGTRNNETTNAFLGAYAGAANFMGGRIYGVVQGSGTLSSTDRASLQTYMAALHP